MLNYLHRNMESTSLSEAYAGVSAISVAMGLMKHKLADRLGKYDPEASIQHLAAVELNPDCRAELRAFRPLMLFMTSDRLRGWSNMAAQTDSSLEGCAAAQAVWPAQAA